MSTSSEPMATGLRWWSVRRPYAVAPLFVPFVLIGYMVPGLAVGLLFALVGGLGENLEWADLALIALIYLTWIAICARLVYTAFKARPVKHLRAAIWGGLCFGASLMPLMSLLAIAISVIAVVANRLAGL